MTMTEIHGENPPISGQEIGSQFVSEPKRPIKGFTFLDATGWFEDIVKFTTEPVDGLGPVSITNGLLRQLVGDAITVFDNADSPVSALTAVSDPTATFVNGYVELRIGGVKFTLSMEEFNAVKRAIDNYEEPEKTPIVGASVTMEINVTVECELDAVDMANWLNDEQKFYDEDSGEEFFIGDEDELAEAVNNIIADRQDELLESTWSGFHYVEDHYIRDYTVTLDN